MENSGTAESIGMRLKWEEAKRRKREGLVILATTLMVLAFAFFEVQLPETAPVGFCRAILGANLAAVRHCGRIRDPFFRKMV
jgi:hypothetical protein